LLKKDYSHSISEQIRTNAAFVWFMRIKGPNSAPLKLTSARFAEYDEFDEVVVLCSIPGVAPFDRLDKFSPVENSGWPAP